MIELIILDMYGTIVGRGNSTIPRRGFSEFMERNQGKRMVVATDDDDSNIVTTNLLSLGILDRLDMIYAGDNMVAVNGYGGKRKDLKRICADFRILPKNAAFISDGEKDREDARRDKVHFVHVPYYERHDERFSFSIIDLSKRLPRYLDLRDTSP
ncbi:HAD family hydrolase [Candidatus Woesearchaeota archaeon]|nr:HAD family hydrolase [Candidatus Woesearchaeota archaeon]